ncbi:SDR family NAD(P)-dependent oxidoreductase [Micromonospora sp. D75]|uniref:SDR family NAD(P)-dependent oxidoreductase n=1 Tax=Micromonospora sp. D75 TaxID=2824885 RepID=UPI001FFCFF60|nr:SDR family NAD(P)-dependent oxidoreductase [Micromonospora sp. D75]
MNAPGRPPAEDAQRSGPGATGRGSAAGSGTPGRSALAGRRVLVTGARGTFGQHLGAALTAAGAHVVGLDLHADPDATPAVLGVDLTDPAATPPAVAAAIDRLGGLDLLINNAGVGGPAPAELPPDEVVRRQIEVNLLAAWRTTAAAMPALEAARGRVIFVWPAGWPCCRCRSQPPTGSASGRSSRTPTRCATK